MISRNYLRNNYHNLRLFPQLIKENSFGQIFVFFLLTLFNVSQEKTLKVAGTTLTLRTSSTDLTVAYSCLVDEEFKIAKQFSNKMPNHFIVDAGGYIGTAAIAFAKMFPSSTIVVIEPSEINFKILQKNVSAFPQIVPLNMALVGKDSTIKLFDHGTGNWGFSAVSSSESSDVKFLQDIQGVSISYLLEKFSKSGVDLLKLDIEGGEKDVLDHSQQWIGKVGMLIAELHERILAGCDSSFQNATTSMKKVQIEGEKVVAINDSYFSV